MSDITDTDEILFAFGVGKNWYEIEDFQEISISLPNIVVPVKE